MWLRSQLKFLLKLAVTAGLCVWLVASLDPDELGRVLGSLEPWHIALALALHVMVFVLNGLRWWLLLQHVDASARFKAVFPSFYLGIFFNNFLPTSMGGDLARVLHLRARGHTLGPLVSSTVVDRFIGLNVVVVLGLVATAWSPELDLGDQYRWALIGVAAALASIYLFLLTPWFSAMLEMLNRRYAHTRVRRFLLEVTTAAYAFRNARGRLAVTSLITIVMQSLVVCVYYVIGTAIGLLLPFWLYFAIIPAVFVAAALPISVGGLGVREGTLVGLLILVGVGRQDALALSLIYLLMLWLSSLPGAFVLLRSGKVQIPLHEGEQRP